MKVCPICGHKIIEERNRCSRFPICSFKEELEYMDVSNYVLFDIETTGFSREKDRIIEIGAIRVRNNQIVDRFSQLVNPGKDDLGNQIYISQRITQLTGITNDMVADKPCEKEAVQAFVTWLQDEPILAGHNIISFDVPFVKAAARRAGVGLKASYGIDTLLETRAVLPLANHKQPTLAQYYGIHYDAHRAVDDSEACFKILQAFIKDTGTRIVPRKLK